MLGDATIVSPVLFCQAFSLAYSKVFFNTDYFISQTPYRYNGTKKFIESYNIT